MKLGWIGVGGPSALVAEDAMERLETISDAYLSVSTPVQVAAPELASGHRDSGADSATRATISSHFRRWRRITRLFDNAHRNRLVCGHAEYQPSSPKR